MFLGETITVKRYLKRKKIEILALQEPMQIARRYEILVPIESLTNGKENLRKRNGYFPSSIPRDVNYSILYNTYVPVP